MRAQCRRCQGNGRYWLPQQPTPFDSSNGHFERCPGCNATGWVDVPDPNQGCPRCGGSGAIRVFTPVPLVQDHYETCPLCGGHGYAR